jgi:ribosomal protein L11 methyltransferase
VITGPSAAEAVGEFLWAMGVGGIVEDRPSPSVIRLRCFLPPSRIRSMTLRHLRRRVRGLVRYGLDPGPATVTARVVESGRWVRAWRTSVRPLRLGRLVVAPTWVRLPAGSGKIVVRIDPGMAFGSGAHPSTRLCLRLLLRYFRPRGPAGGTVIDVGTGSGILAIAAARLGARRVAARDVDPVAAEVARANVRTNGVPKAVRVVRGAGVGGGGPVDLILANIVADVIIQMLPRVRQRLAAGGRVIGSGIVGDRLGAVLDAAATSGLDTVEVLGSGEWRAVVLAPAPHRRRRRRSTA